MKHRLIAAWHRHMHHPVRSAIGAGLGVSLAAWLSGLALGTAGPVPFIIASLGASAVLAFAVPASPLAQPRAVIGGNLVSALAGVSAHKLVPGDPVVAMGLAVGLSIFAMYLARCLHPPGGGLAMIAVMGGPAVTASGYAFALNPVLVNSLLLVGGALVWNNLAGSRYPHRPEPSPAPAPIVSLPNRDDIAAVLDDMADLPDVSLDDLDMIVRAAAARAQLRVPPETKP
jgi:CBS domain-containing membrane protein